jgi:hypothetical protein
LLGGGGGACDGICKPRYTGDDESDDESRSLDELMLYLMLWSSNEFAMLDGGEASESIEEETDDEVHDTEAESLDLPRRCWYRRFSESESFWSLVLLLRVRLSRLTIGSDSDMMERQTDRERERERASECYDGV